MPPKKTPKQPLEYSKVLETHVDFATRTIYMHADVDRALYTWFAISLRTLVGSTPHSQDPITVSLFTDGGEADSGFAIYDLIRGCPVPVDVFGTGEVCSAGVIILQAGRRRVLSPSAHVLIHPVRVTPPSAEMARDHLQSLGHNVDLYLDQLIACLVSRGVKPRVARRLCSRESYVTAAQAVKLGVADRVSVPHAAQADTDLARRRPSPAPDDPA